MAATPEVISSPPLYLNGHASEVLSNKIAYPGALRANGHKSGSRETPGSIYKRMLEVESRLTRLKGELLVEGVACAIPEGTLNSPMLLQPVQDSVVFEEVISALHLQRKLIRTLNEENRRLDAAGINAQERKKILGINGQIPPREILDYPDTANYALGVLGVHVPIFRKKDKDGMERILNSVYVKAVKLSLSRESLARINLAADVAASFFGLKRVSHASLPNRVSIKSEQFSGSVKPLKGQEELPLLWERPGEI